MTSPNVENDPLTATSWPTDAESVLDPHTTEIPLVEDSDQVRRSVPKPPDVDEILRGEYTGWVPVIKAGESQVDAEERARARIRRIEAELDAQEDTGDARSVSMWMTESMAVKLPPIVAPMKAGQPAVVMPASSVKPPAPEVVKSINDILDPPWELAGTDADKVLSPGEALDEARRRIRQMRVDLENNVEMVTRSFEHSVFQLPLRSGLPAPQLFDEPVLPDEDAEYPVHQRPVAEPSIELPEDVFPAEALPLTRATPVELVAPAVPISPELDAIADAIEAALDSPHDDGNRDLAAMVAAVAKRVVVDEDVQQETDIEMPAAESVNEAAAEPELPQAAVDQPPSQPLTDLRDALVAEPVVTMEPDDISSPAPRGSLIDDSEATFLSELLSTLDEVEATVTQLANTTALDDVLAKYADILNSDTSHIVSDEELAEAREVQQRAAETRSDLDAMLRTLKAAAENFAVEAANTDAADAAAVLEDLLAATPEPTSDPGPMPTEVAQPPQPPRLINQVVLEPMLLEPPADPGEPDLGSLVASALRPIDLPPVFRGEPKRPAAQEQGDGERRLPPKRHAERFVAQPGGPRSDTPEESEIDRIIEAAAERSSDVRAASFWDDEDGMPPSRAAATGSRRPDRTEPGTATREGTVFTGSQSATSHLISEQAAQDHSLELVIMRDEIRDLRDRLDSSQKLVEDLMLRLANLTEIALQHRSN